LSFGFKISV